MYRKEVISPYTKTVFGVGYLGEYFYNKSNFNKDKSYIIWTSMLRRCYYKVRDNKLVSYNNVEVCKEWLCYYNFHIWYEEQAIKYKDNISLQVDKDIIKNGNKVYSKEFCILVPDYINYMFISNNHNGLKKGVQLLKNGRYRALCNMHKDGIVKRCHIGYYSTEEEAFLNYKKVKEKHIKDVANIYKNEIPNELYNALTTYEISEY